MATNIRQVVKRRSIAHRVAPIQVIDLTESPLNATDSKNESKNHQLNEFGEYPNLVRNSMEDFVCLQCLEIIDVFGGIYLSHCLHEICIVCAQKLIFESQTVDVKCPIANCQHYFEDGELRQLLTQHEYVNHVNHKTLNHNEEVLYKQLMELQDQSGFIPTSSEFECEICLNQVDAGDGVVLRDCLHKFCIDCVRASINSNEEAVVKCPATICDSSIQDREIRSVLTQAEFDKYSMKILRIAESQCPNTFHCKAANCSGWAIVEDNVIFFRCPICSSVNCLSCAAIHSGSNCLQYQESLKYAGMTDDDRSNHKIDEIVAKNLGMRCPTCKILIMKRDGCDWLRCPMCKTELCWATKQSRWGPRGRGDLSGGCRCSALQKCHPQCRNCH